MENTRIKMKKWSKIFIVLAILALAVFFTKGDIASASETSFFTQETEDGTMFFK